MNLKKENARIHENSVRFWDKHKDTCRRENKTAVMNYWTRGKNGHRYKKNRNN